MKVPLCYIPTAPPTAKLVILNKERLRLEMVCLSDPGLVRKLNEDAVAVDSEYGIAVVADGIGGHRAGDVASRLATKVILGQLRDKVALYRAGKCSDTPLQLAEQAVAAANRDIFMAAQQQAARNGMGTTLALALFHEHRVALLHVGDSRIYRLRDGRLQALTRDDSLLADQVERGLVEAEDARASHNRHLVTRALGTESQVSPHQAEDEVRSGDVYLLCSDGLSDVVEERDIELIMESLHTNLPLAAGHLVQLANDNGGYDNISVALVRVLDPEPAAGRPGWVGRLFGWLTH